MWASKLNKSFEGDDKKGRWSTFLRKNFCGSVQNPGYAPDLCISCVARSVGSMEWRHRVCMYVCVRDEDDDDIELPRDNSLSSTLLRRIATATYGASWPVINGDVIPLYIHEYTLCSMDHGLYIRQPFRPRSL